MDQDGPTRDLDTRDFNHKMPKKTKPQKCPFQPKMSTETVTLIANNRIFEREKSSVNVGKIQFKLDVK